MDEGENAGGRTEGLLIRRRAFRLLFGQPNSEMLEKNEHAMYHSARFIGRQIKAEFLAIELPEFCDFFIRDFHVPGAYRPAPQSSPLASLRVGLRQ